jgi:hypothetical protein
VPKGPRQATALGTISAPGISSSVFGVHPAGFLISFSPRPNGRQVCSRNRHPSKGVECYALSLILSAVGRVGEKIHHDGPHPTPCPHLARHLGVLGSVLEGERREVRA